MHLCLSDSVLVSCDVLLLLLLPPPPPLLLLLILIIIVLLVLQCVPLATEPGIADIATKFEQKYVRCVRKEEECVCSAPDCCDTEQLSTSKW
jgi:hypothetical protein